METKDITACFENTEQRDWIIRNFGQFLGVSQDEEFRTDATAVASRAYWTTQEDCNVYFEEDTIGISPLVAKYGDQAREFAKLLCIHAPYHGTLSSVQRALAA